MAASRAAGSILSFPVTPADRKSFRETVDDYERRLREWLASLDAWRIERARIFEGSLRFENRGRVPAPDVRASLRFPDAFEPVEELPEIDDPPKPPRFKKGSWSDLMMVPDVLPHYENLPVPRFPAPSNVSQPRYRKGSTIVDYRIAKLLHGIPEDSGKPFLLRISEDGDETIPWKIHAENLEEPASGELQLHVAIRTREGASITSLADLLSGADSDETP